MKKILAIMILSILAAAYALPIFALTETSFLTEPPTQCWPQDLCEKQIFQEEKHANWAQTPNSKTECGSYEKSYGKPLGYCYAPPASVNLQIPIGTLKGASTLTQYIPAVYNYLVSIVSIIAIIMIMVGGLRYLTAGGNPSAISSAKETILGAVIGLFLTFGSYVILQTVNPALVSLKLPDIKLIRSSALTNTTATGECPADSPQKTSKVALTNCSNDCDCFKGQTCESVEGSAGQIISASKLVIWSATAVASGAVVGGANVASGAKYIIQGTYDALSSLVSKLGPLVVKNPIKSGAIAYIAVSGLGGSGPASKSVDNGICVQLAKNSIPAGGLCAFNSNCISNKCLDIDTHQELTVKKLGEIGACVGDSKVFSGTLVCTESSTCVANAGPSTDLACVGGFCSWGDENQTCCETAKINGTNTYCDKGENECKTGLSCGFSYNSKIYMMNGQYVTQANNTGLIDAVKTAHANSSGKCIKDADPNWAPNS